MKNWKTAILALGDILAMYTSLFGMLAISHTANFREALASHAFPFSIIFACWLVVFFIFDQYDPIKARPRMLNVKRIGYTLAISLIIGIAIFYIGDFGITPKTNLLLVFVFFAIIAIGLRRLVFKLFTQFITRTVYFAEQNQQTKELKDLIRRNPQLGYIITEDSALAEITISQTPFARGKNLMSLSGAYENLLGKIPVDIAEKTLPYQIKSKQESVASILGKRLFDVLFSISVLVATSWLWPLIIIGIKIDDKGPVLYSQKRTGQNNKSFEFLKFRSMRTDAEKHGAMWAAKEDPRTTRFGRFLRKSHLDEIPQMINILKGDMSVIGPRPERPEFVETLEKEIPLYTLRHVIKPGFTGWAQVKYRYARSVLDSKEKFEYDLYYIKNRNVALDAGILLKTIQIFVTHL